MEDKAKTPPVPLPSSRISIVGIGAWFDVPVTKFEAKLIDGVTFIGITGRPDTFARVQPGRTLLIEAI